MSTLHEYKFRNKFPKLQYLLHRDVKKEDKKVAPLGEASLL